MRWVVHQRMNAYLHTNIHAYVTIIIIIILIIIIIITLIVLIYIAPFLFIKCSKALHIVIVWVIVHKASVGKTEKVCFETLLEVVEAHSIIVVHYWRKHNIQIWVSSKAHTEGPLRLGLYGTISSLMYLGASPLSALYTSNRTLNWMQNWFGSQWSLKRTGGLCSYFQVLDTILAALFCNHCSFVIKSCCIPIWRASHYSKRDITSDCITVFVASLVNTHLAFPILLRWKLDFFTTFLTWGSMLSWESNIAPRFLTGSDPMDTFVPTRERVALFQLS